MEHYLQLITEYAEVYGVLTIVPLLFLENVPIIGFTVPGVTVLFLSGFLSHYLADGPVLVFILAYSTILFADTVWYSLGYWNQTRWRWAQKLADRSPYLERLLTTERKQWLIFYQFIPYFRMFLPFALGWYKYPTKAWFILVSIATLLYTAVYFGIGYGVYRWFTTLESSASILQLLTVLVIIGSLLYGIKLFVKYVQIRQEYTCKSNPKP